MNTYRKKNYRGKRGYSGRPHRRTADSYHQPLPPDQNRIPYARHTLTKPDVESVVDALLSGTLTQGRELERFEGLLAKLTHSDYAIAMNSGTAAVHAALACLKLEPEDEVITSTLNFCAVANMITLVGARPVLVDCDPKTLTIDPEAVRGAINENTKAIFSNNFAGHPSDLTVLRELCEEHGLLLLEDASHGLGGKFRGHYIGNQADLTCFSFHPSKAITTCEGGAVTTNNRIIADRLRLFRHHGIQKDARFFQTQESYGDYYQELQFQGMNYRLSEIHAALGRSQLTRLDRHIERRRSIAQVYYQKLDSVEELVLPYVADWADSAFHIFPIQLTGILEDKRDVLFAALRDAGVDVQVHYVPVHRMPLYAGDFPDRTAFPNAEQYFSRCLTLPLFPDLSYKDLERITDLLIEQVDKIRPRSEKDDSDYRDDSEEKAEEKTEEKTEADASAPEDDTDTPDRDDEPSKAEDSGSDDDDDIPEPPSDTANPVDMPDQDKNLGERPSSSRRGGRGGGGRLRKVPKNTESDEEEEEKPARRPRGRRPVRKTQSEASESESETGGDDSGEEEAPKPRTRRPRRTAKAKDADEKPKTTRRRSASKSKSDEDDSGKADANDEDNAS